MLSEKQLVEEFKVCRAALNALTSNHFVLRQLRGSFIRQKRAVNHAIEYLPGYQMQFNLVKNDK